MVDYELEHRDCHPISKSSLIKWNTYRLRLLSLHPIESMQWLISQRRVHKVVDIYLLIFDFELTMVFGDYPASIVRIHHAEREGLIRYE